MVYEQAVADDDNSSRAMRDLKRVNFREPVSENDEDQAEPHAPTPVRATDRLSPELEARLKQFEPEPPQA